MGTDYSGPKVIISTFVMLILFVSWSAWIGKSVVRTDIEVKIGQDFTEEDWNNYNLWSKFKIILKNVLNVSFNEMTGTPLIIYSLLYLLTTIPVLIVIFYWMRGTN